MCCIFVVFVAGRRKSVPFPSSETPGRLHAEFAARGIRLTKQRRAILQVIETADHHLDAAQILRWAQRIEPSVDRVTVYRTLSLLKKNALVDELDLMHVGGEGHYYERVTRRNHLHITCLRCAKVLEFESPYLAKIRQQVEKDSSFRIEVARLEIGGYCPECLKPNTSETGKPRQRRTHLASSAPSAPPANV
jgi:Fur family transcriptional regulator, ferric uptake regulator